MTRHTLIGHLGKIDGTASPSDETVTNVLLGSADGRLEHGVGNVLRDLKELGVPATDVGIDLLLLAALVHAADTRVARTTESQDTWTRELRLVVPVSAPDRWAACSDLLKTILSFLTGDIWDLTFVPRASAFTLAIGGRAQSSSQRAFDQVSLFSGGLDSLIGGIDAVDAGANPLFVSHASEGATSEAQTACFEGVRTQYATPSLARLRAWISFPEGLVKDVRSENTTRGRSFLFIALGVAAGSGLEQQFVLEIPENGLIALNVPLDVLRLGSLSTRTTHPFYLARWNELLRQLGIPALVTNRYWNRTKGEMAAECRNPSLLQKLVPSSMSCSSPAKARWQGHGIEHCGYCVPCLIRRAAIERAWGRGNDPTTYTVADLSARPLDTRQAEGQQVRSFQLAAARLKAKPGIERILIHKSGPLRDEEPRLAELASVYRRGMDEVGALLANTIAKPS
ncbi:MAG: hypothetical protein BGO98_13630 [Myxococcales bacterium 68-20]|nr:hypothetical protein [Myxococcales bacterium]OJY17179.1 MAG: hypothetical protein BGO98_13630 [Myxococcales bacterium 68-20]